jgi:hypothetical protein
LKMPCCRWYKCIDRSIGETLLGSSGLCSGDVAKGLSCSVRPQAEGASEFAEGNWMEADVERTCPLTAVGRRRTRGSSRQVPRPHLAKRHKEFRCIASRCTAKRSTARGLNDASQEGRHRVGAVGEAPCCSESDLGNTAGVWRWRIAWRSRKGTGFHQCLYPGATAVSAAESFWGCSRSLARMLANLARIGIPFPSLEPLLGCAVSPAVPQIVAQNLPLLVLLTVSKRFS